MEDVKDLSMDLMSLAKNTQPKDMINAEASKNQISMFLVAQARNELYRIIKLTSFLDTVEAKYMDVATELMQQYPDNLSLVQNVMETINKSLARSNELLTQVLRDDKLNSYSMDISIHNEEGEKTDISNLSSASRADIMNFAKGMLAKLDKATQIPLENVVEEKDVTEVNE